MPFNSTSSKNTIQRWDRQHVNRDRFVWAQPRFGARVAGAVLLALLFLLAWLLDLLSADSVLALFFLCGVEIMSFPFYLFFFKRFRKRILQAYCHWITDIIVITLALHFLGGEQAFIFSFAYCLVILSSSMVARRRDSFFLATLSAFCYLSLLFLEGTGIIPSRPVWSIDFGARERLFFPVWSVSFFFLIAYFSSLFSERLRERGRILEIMNAVSRVSSSSLALQGILDRMLHFILEHHKVEFGLIRLTSFWPEMQQMDKETRKFPDDLPEEEKISFEKLIGVLATENGPTIIQDHESDPRSKEFGIKRIGSMISAPIIHKGENVGIFILFRSKTKNGEPAKQFQREDLDLLSMIALQIAPAIVNARLYTNLEESNKNLRRAQDDIVKVEKFEALEEMITGLGHQFRNPLLAIGAAAKRLAKSNRIPEEMRFYVQIMQKETEKVERILKDVPGFQIGKGCVRKEVDINALIERTLSLVFENENDDGIHIEREYTMLKDPYPSIDMDQFEVALYNIFCNAKEAMGEEGMLTVETKIESGSESRILSVEISDTGGGISTEEVDNIFNPFYTTKHWGAGLGLTMTHRIVENHGGNIQILNRPGEGVTFQINIPNA